MKKWIVFLAALMLLAVITVPVFAANTEVSITPASSTLYPGDEVEFTVNISSSAPYTAIIVDDIVDEQVFDVVGFTKANPNAQIYDYSDDSLTATFEDGNTYSGSLLTIKLKLKENVTAKSATVGKGSVVVRNGNDVLAVSFNPAKITIGCRHSVTTWQKADDNNHTGNCSKCNQPQTAAHSWTKAGTTPAGCESPGADNYTCACGATKSVPIAAKGHAWDNACDTKCNNNCGTTRAASHKYKTTWSSDGKNHWHECSTCGSKKDSAAHTPGAAATETTAQTCTVCSYVIQPALGHVHQFDDTWQQNSDYHWHVCKREGCHDTQGKTYHDYDNNCDLTCNTCGHIRVAPHEPGTEFESNEKGHWYICTLCQEPSEIIPHTPGEPATMDTPQVCTECQYWVKFPLSHVHTWGEAWEADDMNHWRACVECREPSDAQPHAWDAGTVLIEPTKNSDGKISFVCEECKIERTATIPKLEPDPNETTEPTQTQPIKPSDNSEEFPWWILIVAAGVLLIAGIALFVFEFIRSKKYNSHGKFSSK